MVSSSPLGVLPSFSPDTPRSWSFLLSHEPSVFFPCSVFLLLVPHTSSSPVCPHPQQDLSPTFQHKVGSPGRLQP